MLNRRQKAIIVPLRLHRRDARERGDLRQLAGPEGTPNRPQVINLSAWPYGPPKLMKPAGFRRFRRSSERLAGGPAEDQGVRPTSSATFYLIEFSVRDRCSTSSRMLTSLL